MNLQFSSDGDFSKFKQEISEKLGQLGVRTIVKPEFRPSAVMMLILNREGSAHILLTRRTTTVATHKGEVSFPGGSFEEGDTTLLETALRETYEEVGILPGHIEVLGEFDHFISIFGFHVSTFVGVITHPYEYLLNPGEIESIVEVPLQIFRDEKYDKCQLMEYQGNTYNVYHYMYEGYEIWGLTARILTDFARKILQQ
ncbi:MAG: NUDIX hydrolase [Spirochaetota bacterium]